jgi:cyanate permease
LQHHLQLWEHHRCWQLGLETSQQQHALRCCLALLQWHLLLSQLTSLRLEHLSSLDLLLLQAVVALGNPILLQQQQQQQRQRPLPRASCQARQLQ